MKFIHEKKEISEDLKSIVDEKKQKNQAGLVAGNSSSSFGEFSTSWVGVDKTWARAHGLPYGLPYGPPYGLPYFDDFIISQ